MRAEQQILVPFESFTEQLGAFLKAASTSGHIKSGSTESIMMITSSTNNNVMPPK